MHFHRISFELCGPQKFSNLHVFCTGRPKGVVLSTKSTLKFKGKTINKNLCLEDLRFGSILSIADIHEINLQNRTKRKIRQAMRVFYRYHVTAMTRISPFSLFPFRVLSGCMHSTPQYLCSKSPHCAHSIL